MVLYSKIRPTAKFETISKIKKGEPFFALTFYPLIPFLPQTLYQGTIE